ncbi:Mini-ribonuclease 3 [Pseudogracilibacillus sp. SE30717A]|uniref:Mini-ribonuclease 3 n=1 Tax=Pseudogracilibacillus sp. SE30717A TaxID=3098293 RepID=UPI00300DF6C2
MSVQVKQLNSLALAYVGDAVYELYVRHHLIEAGQVKPNELHKKAITYVAASAQAAIIHHWLDEGKLNEEEAAVVRRGRNAKSGSTPKNMSIQDYRYATAFEALIGYYYLLKNRTRLDELITEAIQYITNKDKDK